MVVAGIPRGGAAHSARRTGRPLTALILLGAGALLATAHAQEQAPEVPPAGQAAEPAAEPQAPPPVQAGDTLSLSFDQTRYDLGPYLEIVEDASASMTIDEIAAPQFSNSFYNPDSLNFGVTSSAYWVRFTIEEPMPLPGPRTLGAEWILDIGWWNISKAQLYIPELDGAGAFTGDWIVQEAGVPQGDEEEGDPDKTLLVFMLPQDLEQPRTCYLRVESETVLFLPIEISTALTYLDKYKRRMLALGMYYGLILAMVLYNLVLYVSLRDRNYLWYVLYVSFLGLYFAGINGLIHQYIFPGITAGAVVRLDLSFLGLALFGTGLFTRSFLVTRRNAPIADRFVMFYTAIAGVLVLFSPFAGAGTVKFYALFGQVATLIPIGAGLVCWRSGFRPARFFLLAWTIFTIGGMIYAFTWKGVLPYNVWTLHSFQISTAVEAIVLSLALGDRVRILRWEREEARRSERRYMELAITDGLTSLFNARYFRGHIGPEIQRVESLDHPLALLMMDVDNFKHFNDAYGHPEGDKVLASLGQVILSCIRDNDMACRYGGEEFAVVLPGSTGATAVEVAERIRANFEAKNFVPRPGETVHATVSVGVAEHITGQDWNQLVERADKALYESKHRGKNTITLAKHR